MLLAFTLGPAIVSALLIAWLARTRAAHRLADRPNARSLHAEPTPRIGGIGIVVAGLAFAAAVGDSRIVVIAMAAAALAFVSFLDDLRSLPIEVRLPAHFVVALVAVLAFAGDGLDPLSAGTAVLLVLAIVWGTNLFNFMDGADGLAGGMAAIGFTAYAIAAIDAGAGALGLASIAVASASVGFLAYNFPPARVFMGDAGSIPLGFLAAAFGAYGALRHAWPAWFPLLVFSPFIVDATVTLLRRLARRERVWVAHRTHYYQRLVLSGWSARRLAIAAYALMIAAAASALASREAGGFGHYVIIAAWTMVHSFILLLIDRRAPLGPPA